MQAGLNKEVKFDVSTTTSSTVSTTFGITNPVDFNSPTPLKDISM